MRYSKLFWVHLNKYNENIDNLSLKIYVNKTENRITRKVKT